MRTSSGKLIVGVTCGLALLLAARQSCAQQPRIRVPSNTSPTFTPGGSAAATPPSLSTPPATGPTFGTPAFDPYAASPGFPTVPNAATVPPTLPGTTTPATPRPLFGSPTSPAFGTPPSTPPTWPAWTDPAATTPAVNLPNTGYPAPYPQQPTALFPNGVMPDWSQNFPWSYAQEGRYMRLFQDLRLTHTWLHGGDGPREMGINESEVGTTVNFPNFFWSGQPLQVSPAFAMHWWDGPETRLTPPNLFPTELPSRVYSAYLAFGWQPYITPQLSADLEGSVGVFTDFEGYTNDSLRFQGTGLGVLTLTPNATLKAGVTYLDRVDIKLLPAAGILWIPNPQTRWDIYFPRPKVSRYLTTIGNTDVWIYLNGEYGGGSWTVRRAGASDRRVDINDIRVGGGLEWTHPFGLRGFAEAAYVFDRELVFASGVPDRHKLKDTVMVRGGLVW